MRVLQVAEASGSGTFEVLRSIASGAAAAGHQVLVAVGERPETPSDVAATLPPHVEVELLPWTTRGVGAQLTAARALRALVGAWRPDIVHLHSAFAGAVGAVAVTRRIPVVYTPHGSPTIRGSDPALKRAFYRVVESAVVRRATVVGAVSETEAEVARTLLGATRVRVVSNGIADLDPLRIPAAAPKPARPLVVATGRIGPQRRPQQTADILSGVRDLADVCWIGGAPSGEDAPLHAAGIPVTGWLDRGEALERLAAATVCVHWSAWDGLSLALLEAFARDVVVIASDIPANRDVVGPRQVAADVARATELVRRVLRDGQLRASLLADQRQQRGRFSAACCVEGWLAVYRSCLPAQS